MSLAKEGATYTDASVRTDARRLVSVEIGDAKQAEFYPQAKSLLWGNEVNFGMRLQDPGTDTPVVGLADDVVSWETSDRIARFYNQADPTVGRTDPGFEFEVVLKVPPATNELVFTIQHKGLDFFKATPMSARMSRDDPLVVRATDLEAFDVNDRVVRSQPEHILGGYSVYHQTKAFGLVGGMNYGAGKAFQIYRPWIENRIGERVWCDLDIDEIAGTLTITIPQAFLDRALAQSLYPLTIDPTVGYTSVGSSFDSTNNFILACKFAAPEAGDANTGTLYAAVRRQSGTGSIETMHAWYENGSSNPDGVGKLSSDVSINVSDTTQTFKSGTVTWTGITATDYWASYNGITAAGIHYDNASNTIYYAAREHSSDMPDPWVTNTGSFTGRLSAYVDYTASGGAANPHGPLGHPLHGPFRGPVGA